MLNIIFFNTSLKVYIHEQHNKSKSWYFLIDNYLVIHDKTQQKSRCMFSRLNWIMVQLNKKNGPPQNGDLQSIVEVFKNGFYYDLLEFMICFVFEGFVHSFFDNFRGRSRFIFYPLLEMGCVFDYVIVEKK